MINDRLALEEELLELAADCAADPLRFVMEFFPWGEVGFDLAEFTGPDDWQVKILEDVRDGLLTIDQAIQEAVVSGHGVGKSALVSWIILWALSTAADTKGVVTANTETQLKTKTWAELAKWHRLCLCAHWFTFTATALYSVDPKHERTWRVDMVPWSLANTEAFAGLHNLGKRLLVVFDEASAIPDLIWEVTEGALTDSNTQIIWCAFGNGTRNSGRFKECFGRFKARWKRHQVDSRTARMTNKTQIEKWLADYGEDSDFFKVRVKGEFPRAGSNQFISPEDVSKCRKYRAEGFQTMPKVFGVDVARFGDDQSVVVLRQGRYCKTLCRLSGLGVVQVAERIIALVKEHDPDAVVVDGDGIGGGVVDVLRSRGYDKRQGKTSLFEFHGGEAARDSAKYFNRRAEVWGDMNDALKAGMQIDDDPELEADLTGPEYGYNGKGQIQLEKKEDMKKRGLSSPDLGDALAYTFAVQVNANRLGAPSPVRRPAPRPSKGQGGRWMR